MTLHIKDLPNEPSLCPNERNLEDITYSPEESCTSLPTMVVSNPPDGGELIYQLIKKQGGLTKLQLQILENFNRRIKAVRYFHTIYTSSNLQQKANKSLWHHNKNVKVVNHLLNSFANITNEQTKWLSTQ